MNCDLELAEEAKTKIQIFSKVLGIKFSLKKAYLLFVLRTEFVLAMLKKQWTYAKNCFSLSY